MITTVLVKKITQNNNNKIPMRKTKRGPGLDLDQNTRRARGLVTKREMEIRAGRGIIEQSKVK